MKPYEKPMIDFIDLTLNVDIADNMSAQGGSIWDFTDYDD